MTTGSGRSHKPHVVNQGMETTFKTESTRYKSVGGPIQEQPSLTLKNESLVVKEQSELGSNYKIKKGGSAHTFGFNYSIENWKALWAILGGMVEQVWKFDVASTTNFDDTDEIVTGDGAKTYGRQNGAVSGSTVTLHQFATGDTVTNGVETATLVKIEGNQITVKNTSGSFASTGYLEVSGSAGAKITYSAVDSDGVVFTIDPDVVMADGSTVSPDGGTTDTTVTASTIIYSHEIFAHQDQPCFSFEYNYDSLDNQHNLLGCVATDVSVSGSGNEIPTVQENYMCADSAPDSTKDTGKANATTELFLFEDLTLTINGTDYSALVKTRELKFTRDLTKLWTTSLTPDGIRGPEISSEIKVGIYREDYELYNLRINDVGDEGAADTSLPVVFTFTRTATTDVCTITFATCRSLEASEGENDKSVFVDLNVEVEGTPTVQVYDKDLYG